LAPIAGPPLGIGVEKRRYGGGGEKENPATDKQRAPASIDD